METNEAADQRRAGTGPVLRGLVAAVATSFSVPALQRRPVGVPASDYGRSIHQSQQDSIFEVSHACAVCPHDAEFSTPYGGLCLVHTRRAVFADDELWIPKRIGDEPS